MDDGDVLPDLALPKLEGTMLEHPVFVFWCVACGREAPGEARPCPRCSGRVERHQRILELPDPPPAPAAGGSDGLLSLRSLRAALADISVGEGVGGSAALLFEHGPDQSVAALYPELAGQLSALEVPPAVQRALVNRGFVSWELIRAAVANASDVNALATQLGVASPAAEVLLRRFSNAAARETGLRVAPRLGTRMASASPGQSGGHASERKMAVQDQAEGMVRHLKRPCLPLTTVPGAMSEESDGEMQAVDAEELSMDVPTPA